MPRRASRPEPIATGVTQFVFPAGDPETGIIRNSSADEWHIDIFAVEVGDVLTIQGPVVLGDWDGTSWGEMEELVPEDEQIVVRNRLSFLVRAKTGSMAVALSSGAISGGAASATVTTVERA
jgi:hypothetical protein